MSFLIPGTKVYIAGPMRGYDHFNFPAFDAVASILRSWFCEVRSPAEHDRETGFDETLNSLEGFDMQKALRWDLEQVLWADVVVLLPGWEPSSGVEIELRTARAVGVPVFEFDPEAEEVCWLDEDCQKQRQAEALGYIPLHSVNVQPGEVTVVNESTGGAKGKKLARFDLIPPGPLMELAKHYGRGAEKYDDRNWELGTDWSLNFAAMMRHAWAFWGGEDIDAETGSPHLVAAAWHCFALLEYMRTHPELDDRSVAA